MLWYDENTIYDVCEPNSTSRKSGVSNFMTEIIPELEGMDKSVVVYAGDLGAFENGCAVMYHEFGNIKFIGSGMGGGKKDNVVITNIYNDGSISFELIALNGEDRKALGELEDYRI